MSRIAPPILHGGDCTLGNFWNLTSQYIPRATRLPHRKISRSNSDRAVPHANNFQATVHWGSAGCSALECPVRHLHRLQRFCGLLVCEQSVVHVLRDLLRLDLFRLLELRIPPDRFMSCVAMSLKCELNESPRPDARSLTRWCRSASNQTEIALHLFGFLEES